MFLLWRAHPRRTEIFLLVSHRRRQKLIKRPVLFQSESYIKTRKAVIEISLVEESKGKTNEEIEKEILRELSVASIPRCKKIENVKVVESHFSL